MAAISPDLAEAFAMDLSQYKPQSNIGSGDCDILLHQLLYPIPRHVILAVTTRLEQAGRVRDAAEYAYAKRDYLLAAQLLIKADDAAAALRLLTRATDLLYDNMRQELAEEMLKRHRDTIWAAILLHCGSSSEMRNRALEVVKQRNAQRTAEGQCVPSLTKFALWRIAQNFTAQHRTLRSVAAIDALLALRTRMIDDLFESLALHQTVVNWNNKDLLEAAIENGDEACPLMFAYLVGASLHTNPGCGPAREGLLKSGALLRHMIETFKRVQLYRSAYALSLFAAPPPLVVTASQRRSAVVMNVDDKPKPIKPTGSRIAISCACTC